MAVNPIKVWNGTAWEYTGPVVAAPPVKYQATQPTSPATGDVWVESDVDVATFDPSQIVRGGAYVNEAARASAITSPVTGMITYVGDTGTETPSSTIPQIETYTGSAWQTPYGLTQLANVNFTSATSIVVDNVFSSVYANYEILVDYIGAGNASGKIIFRDAGGDISAANYQTQRLDTLATSVSGFRDVNSTTGQFPDYGQTRSVLQAKIYAPNLAQPTQWQAIGSYNAATTQPGINFAFGVYNANTQATGFRLSSSAALTGNMKVYGYRNS